MSSAKFGTLYLDPPWQERGGGKVKRGADRHYPLMSLDDIHRTIMLCPELRPADDAHCWMWVTNNFLPQGLELMRRLGFRYVTNAVWVKAKEKKTIEAWKLRNEMEDHLQIGLGQYMRGAHELLLFGTRGKAMVPHPDRRFPSVIIAPRRRHSQKPEVAYERIEAVSPEPRLEMFARSRRPGWTSWGDQL